MSSPETSLPETEVETDRVKAILQVLTQTASFSYRFDVTTGLVSSEIIDKNQVNYTAVLGLKPPFFYNEIFLRVCERGMKHFLQGKVIQCTQEYLLNAFAQGTNNLEIILSTYPMEKASFRLNFILIQNKLNSHVEAFVIGKKLENTNPNISEQENSSAFVKAIKEIYPTVFWVDLKENTIKIESLEYEFDLWHLLGNTFKDYTYAEVMNHYVNYFVITKEREFVRQSLSLTELSKRISLKKSWSLQYTCLDKKKQPFLVEARLIPLQEKEDSLLIGLRTIEDLIHPERERNQALSSALKMSAEESKSKTEFLRNISHNFRTPMNSINGFTELALAHLDQKDLVREYLNKISSSSNYLLSLVNNINELNRVESNKVKIHEGNISLPDFIQELKSSFSQAIHDKNQELTFSTNRVIHENIISDKTRLTQILTVLLSNASKYTPNGGKITLEIVETANGKENFGDFEFHIKDTGCGIEKNLQEHIFEPFAKEKYNESDHREGSGLSLAIVKSLITLLNGRITLQSEPGSGSEFTVSLTLRVTSKGNTGYTIASLKGKRALIIANTFNTALNLSKMVRSIGMLNEWALSAQEAVNRLKNARQNHITFATILVQGFPTLEENLRLISQLKALVSQQTSFLFLTNSEDTHEEMTLQEAGVNYILHEPVFLSQLYDILGKSDQKKEETETLVRQFSGKSVLIVEDNLLNQEITVEILKEAGIHTETADDGLEAIETLKQNTHFDLILMDIQMPHMDGYEATRRIRLFADKKLAQIPIIAMTANAFDKDRELALAAGMNDFIAKPINLEIFFETLSKYLK